jgi:hypothetical protein
MLNVTAETHVEAVYLVASEIYWPLKSILDSMPISYAAIDLRPGLPHRFEDYADDVRDYMPTGPVAANSLDYLRRAVAAEEVICREFFRYPPAPVETRRATPSWRTRIGERQPNEPPAELADRVEVLAEGSFGLDGFRLGDVPIVGLSLAQRRLLEQLHAAKNHTLSVHDLIGPGKVWEDDTAIEGNAVGAMRTRVNEQLKTAGSVFRVATRDAKTTLALVRDEQPPDDAGG